MRCPSNDGAEPPPLRIKLPADARSRRRNGIWPPAHRDDGGSASPPRPQEKDLLRRRSGSAAALNDLEKSKRMVCLPDRWDPLICRPRIDRPAGVGLNFWPSYCTGRLPDGKNRALFLVSG